MVISTPQPLWIRTRMHLVISPSVPYTFYKGDCPVSQLTQFGPFTFLICFELGFFALPQKVSGRVFYYIMVSIGGKAPWTIPVVSRITPLISGSNNKPLVGRLFPSELVSNAKFKRSKTLCGNSL
jgi:hypothetical protein